MNIIRTICGSCDKIAELHPTQIITVPGPQADYVALDELLYACPTCLRIQLQPIDWRNVALLIAARVTAVPALSPNDYRPTHPEQPPPGSPLTPDDLLDLHQLLHTDHWLDELRAAVNTSTNQQHAHRQDSNESVHRS
jgi:hypothetical protein